MTVVVTRYVIFGVGKSTFCTHRMEGSSQGDSFSLFSTESRAAVLLQE